MKTEDKNNVPKVKIVVLGNVNVGKSGYFERKCVSENKNANIYFVFVFQQHSQFAI